MPEPSRTGIAAVGARVWERALDLVFPQRCVGCDSFGSLICDECAATMTPALAPRCDVCWMAFRWGSICSGCSSDRPEFQQMRSAFVYEGVARDAVIALKFRGLSSIAPLMAAMMAERILDWGPPVDIIAHVPLASRRKKERGYDQAGLLAKELSKHLKLPHEPRALKRIRHTVSQVDQPDEDARRRNVADAFSAGSRSVEGSVLLVDDVVTTGSTLDACAEVLASGGGGPVYALTFARED